MNRYTTTFKGIENIINEPLFGESFDNDEELLYLGWTFGLIINYSHKTTVIDS